MEDMDDAGIREGDKYMDDFLYDFLEIIVRVENSLNNLTKIVNWSHKKKEIAAWRIKRLLNKSKDNLHKLNHSTFLLFWVRSNEDKLKTDMKKLDDELKNNAYFKRYGKHIKEQLKATDNSINALLRVIEYELKGIRESKKIYCVTIAETLKSPMHLVIEETKKLIDVWLSQKSLRIITGKSSCRSPRESIEKLDEIDRNLYR